MSKRPQWVAFGAVVLLVLVLLNLPDSVAARTKLAVSSLFLPLFGLVGSAHQLAGDGVKTVVPRSALIQDLDKLRQENQTLRLELARSKAQEEENRRLRQIVGWQQVSPWKFRPCHIIARDTANWWSTVRVDVGSRDGVRRGLPIVTAEGLVGRLETVGVTASDVVLIGDPKCRVSVVVRETGESGVLATLSGGVLDHRLVDLTHLPRNSLLRPGMTVYTSGMGGVFPAGIPVGTIVDSRSVGYGLYSEARVRLAADTSRLREVLVLLP